MRHRRRADLARLEALGDQLLPDHQADRGGQRGRAGDDLGQGRDHVEVERARVDLADADQHALEAQVAGDALLEGAECVEVAVEQVELVGGGADRALDPA